MANVGIDIRFTSNGNSVMGQLTANSDRLAKSIVAVKKKVDSITGSFESFVNTCASMGFAFQSAVDGLDKLAEPTISFDKAMRAANTMAGKGADDFKKLSSSVSGLAKEIPLAREALAGGLYQGDRSVD